MEFDKYQHLEKFGTVETQGIEFGTCYVFPKLDGTNGSLWWHPENGLQAGSRNRHLTLDYDNQGFYNWAVNQGYDALFKAHPNLRLFGEWLVPHTIRTYSKEAWNKFYVFDVMEGERHLHYKEYKAILDRYQIEYIPPMGKISNPTYEKLLELVEVNSYCIEDGKGCGEGIVVKNYDYKNKFGRVVWAKIVRNAFKAEHQRCNVSEIKDKKLVEQEIVEKYITAHLVDKEYAKIEAGEGWASKRIPQLLNTVFYCLVKEEGWNFVKEFKQPSIDFKRLQHFTFHKVKELKPELF